MASRRDVVANPEPRIQCSLGQTFLGRQLNLEKLPRERERETWRNACSLSPLYFSFLGSVVSALLPACAAPSRCHPSRARHQGIPSKTDHLFLFGFPSPSRLRGSGLSEAFQGQNAARRQFPLVQRKKRLLCSWYKEPVSFARNLDCAGWCS